jgi:RNA-directed DNA polymerase
MSRTHPDLPWCRYADDGLVHCRSEQEAEALRDELQARLEMCGLQMHPTKTKIVYCKDNRRRGDYPNVTFDFLGYSVQAATGSELTADRGLLWLHPSGQPHGAQVHSGDDQELEHSPADAGDAG